MTDIVEILIKSDKSIIELDDDFLFSQNVLSVSQYRHNGELYFNLLFDQKDRSCIKKIISKLFGSSQYFQINKVKNKNWRKYRSLMVMGRIHVSTKNKNSYRYSLCN